MINNTELHISSWAKTVLFDPENNVFPITVQNMQQFIEAFDTNAAGPLPAASTSKGVAKIATTEEVLAGVDNTKIVTPYTLYQKWIRPQATEKEYGVTMYASSSLLEEENQGTDKGVTTYGVWDVITEFGQGQENIRGTHYISDTFLATAGVDDSTVMTPAKVKQAIDTFAVTVVPTATENINGTVKISPVAVNDVNKHDEWAVSPRGFILTRATETQVGTVRLANQNEANARADNSLALSPARLPHAAYDRSGAFHLYHTFGSGIHNVAMSAHAGQATVDHLNGNIVAKSGSEMWGDLHGNLHAQNVNTGDGRSMINLNFLNQVLNDQPSGTAFWRGFQNLWQWGWIHMGDFHYTAQSDGRWRGCEITLPTFHMEASGGGCRPWFHYFILVEHSDGVANRSQALNRIWVPNDRYGNGLSASVTPTYTFPISPNATWTRVHIMIESSCMHSPRMVDGIALMTRTPY